MRFGPALRDCIRVPLLEHFPYYRELLKFNEVQLFEVQLFLTESCANIAASVYTHRENALAAWFAARMGESRFIPVRPDYSIAALDGERLSASTHIPFLQPLTCAIAASL